MEEGFKDFMCHKYITQVEGEILWDWGKTCNVVCDRMFDD